MLKLFFALVLLLSTVNVHAQSNKKADDLINDAKKYLTERNYTGAIKICNQILKTHPEFKDAHLVLADVYNSLDSVDLEILHLNKAGEIGREWEVVFKLGEAYFKKGDIPEALRYYNIYSANKYIPEKRQFLLACKMASCRFTINSLNNLGQNHLPKNGNRSNLNTDEYWPTPSADGKRLVFSRISKDTEQSKPGKMYLSVPDSTLWDITKPPSDTVEFDNLGVQILSDETKILFFTACNRQDGLGDCDIYFVRFENGKWGNPTNAGTTLNSGLHESQPSFSPENRMLYFTSNRTGSKGKLDIWKAELTGFGENGMPQWKQPLNLGSFVNTSGNETSPLIATNNRDLYFVSDVLPGMGGKDLFVAQLGESGNISEVKNLGYPVNTHNDEFEITMSSIGGTAYFASSRLTEKGTEIFAFNLDRGIETTPVAYARAKVRDMKTKQPLSAAVKLENQSLKTNQFQAVQTDNNGEAMFCLQLKRNYMFSVSEPGYLFFSNNMQPEEANSMREPVVLDIELQPIEIGAEVQLYNIYFETDSFRILPQSEPELQYLVAFLKNNAKLKVEIQGHTDSSGNPENNMKLSGQRSKSVVDYLVKNGIELNRLKFSGYGDRIPIASNETAEGRTLNRRTTIKILE